MLRIIYNFIFYLISPLLPLRLLWRGRKNPAYRDRWHERFASYQNRQPLSASIWIHAVSVGEAIAAFPLIKTLKQNYPDMPIVVTTMTPTGAERLQNAFGNGIIQLYVPYDYSGAVKSFLRYVNPKILIIMETELWPNLLHYTAKQNISIVLVNARLSTKSCRGYKKIGIFVKQMLQNITIILAQSENDANNFRQLGADAKKVLPIGNIKFDIEIPENIKTDGLELKNQCGKNRKILVAASTHAGEEEKILIAFKTILQQKPDTLLIIVPRHPERFHDVSKLCQQQGFNYVNYNDFFAATTKTCLPQDVNIIVGNVMGKLLLFYAAADIAFVGGSFVNNGGHNMLEPAAFGIPILTGPNLHNFTAISELMLRNNAMIKINDENELADKVVLLLNDNILCKQYGLAAQQIVDQNKGVTQKILGVIKKFIVA